MMTRTIIVIAQTQESVGTSRWLGRFQRRKATCTDGFTVCDINIKQTYSNIGLCFLSEMLRIIPTAIRFVVTELTP